MATSLHVWTTDTNSLRGKFSCNADAGELDLVDQALRAAEATVQYPFRLFTCLSPTHTNLQCIMRDESHHVYILTPLHQANVPSNTCQVDTTVWAHLSFQSFVGIAGSRLRHRLRLAHVQVISP